MTKEFEDLRFIRVFTPDHIPFDLIEQVRDRDFQVEDWFAYQRLICLNQTQNGLMLNPLNMLYVIADKTNKVQGMLWAEVEPLSKSLVIQTFSMKKEYWNKGKAVLLLEKQAKKIKSDCNLKKIYWITNYPRHSKRYGFRQSKSVLMEYTEVEDGKDIDGKHEACGERLDDDSRTGSLSRTDLRAAEPVGSRHLGTVLTAV